MAVSTFALVATCACFILPTALQRAYEVRAKLPVSAQAYGHPGVNVSCSHLASIFPEEVQFPGSTEYQLDNRYFASNVILEPSCIFTPLTATAAATAVRHLVKANTVFAVRSGGHSFNIGFSDTAVGVVINLKNLNQVTVSTDRKTVKLGTGGRWADVYAELQTYGLSVPGGRSKSIGVGGFSLGGGLSWYLYERGFACDNILEYEIILPNGDLTTASANKNHDLFKALKGSGGQYGLVTAFTFKTIPLDPSGLIYGGFVVASEPSVPAFLEAIAEFTTNGTSDHKSHVIATLVMLGVSNEASTALTPTIATSGIYFYRDPLPHTPDVLKPFVDIDPTLVSQNTLGITTVASLTTQVNGGEDTRQEYLPWTVKNPTATLLNQLTSIWKEEHIGLIGEVDGLLSTLNFIPIGQDAVAAGIAAGGNMLGLEIGVNLLEVHFDNMWNCSCDDEKVYTTARRAYDRSVALAKREGMYSEFIYMNYAAADQDVVAHYGRKSVDFMTKIKERYDPTRVWGRLVRGLFKIPN